MNDGDKKRFAVAMNWLAEKMARDGEPTELSKQQLADYFKALNNLSIGAVEGAVNRCFSNSRFRVFPLPGEIRANVTASDNEDRPLQLPETTAPVLPPDLLEQYQQESQKVFALMQSDASLEEKVWKMRLMEQSFPGFGWGESAEQVETVCAKLIAANAERYERIAEERRNAFSGSA